MSRSCALSPHQLNRLDLACISLREAFDATPYLVGSTMTRPERGDYRDVDVRLILDDGDFDRIFGRGADDDGAAHGDPLWTLLCSALSEWLGSIAGLPVDFQIQRRTEANAAHPNTADDPNPRNPLGRMRAFSSEACQ